jgi:hypothetical protein
MSMNNMNGMISVRGLAALYLMVEIVKFLVGTFYDKSALASDESHKLTETYNVLSARDGDGLPLVYTPRSLIDLNRQQVSILEKIHRDLGKVCRK